MKLPRRNFLHLAAGAAALPAVSRFAWAQTYPSKPVTIVVPFAAGGPVDLRARSLAEHMRSALGQPIIIENVSGAAGSLGAGRVARSAPDGYTLAIGIWSTHVVNGAVYRLQYDVLNDFEPVALLTNNPQLIVGKKTLAANDLKGLVAWLKANPDQALAGTAGVGSPQHVFGILFQNATSTRVNFVHYRGGAPAMQDLVAGQIDLIVADLTTSLPQVRAGSIKPYAFTGRSRSAVAPDVPTTDEAGLPGLGCHETSPPTISASGRRRCRAPGRIAHREGASLSGAAGAHHRRLSRRWPGRHPRPPDQSMAVGAARSAIHCREPAGRRQQYCH